LTLFVLGLAGACAANAVHQAKLSVAARVHGTVTC